MIKYDKTKWVDGTTVLRASHMEKIEKGITDIIDYNNSIYTDEAKRKENEIKREEEHNKRLEEINSSIKDIQTDYDSLQKVIIDENASANLQNQINQTNSQLEQKTNKFETNNIQTQINNLVLGAVGDGNNAEVIQARGNFSVLNDRLNNTDLYIDMLTSRQISEFTPINELPSELVWNDKGYMWGPDGDIVSSAYASETRALKIKLPVIEGFVYELNRFQGNYFLYDKEGKNGTQYTNTSSQPLKITIPKGKCYLALNVDTLSMSIEKLTHFNRLTPTINDEKEACFTMPKLMLDNEQLQLFKKLDGKKIVNLGDSIFGNARPPYDISTKISELTGAIVYNCGFGGTNAGRHSNEVFDAFSLYRLSDAITSKDWSLQNENVNGDGTLNYYSETLNLLKELDFNEIDIVTISHGTNDFGNGLQPEGYKNTDISNRFKYYDGSLSYAIETLLNTYPHLQIFLITPHYRIKLDGSNSFVEDSNTWEIESWVGSGGNHKLTDFVNTCKDIGKEYQIPVIDNYYNLGINKFNRLHYFPVNDGTHHNQNGRDLIAKHISKELY